jgi:hypothetical protein
MRHVLVRLGNGWTHTPRDSIDCVRNILAGGFVGGYDLWLFIEHVDNAEHTVQQEHACCMPYMLTQPVCAPGLEPPNADACLVFVTARNGQQGHRWFLRMSAAQLQCQCINVNCGRAL